MCQKLKCENEYLRVWVSFKKIKNVAVSLLKTLSHTQRALCVWVETDCVSASLPPLWWLSYVWEGRPFFIGWIKSSFTCSILIEGVCYLFWPLPLSLSRTHTLSCRGRGISLRFLAWGRGVDEYMCLFVCLRACVSSGMYISKPSSHKL